MSKACNKQSLQLSNGAFVLSLVFTQIFSKTKTLYHKMK